MKVYRNKFRYNRKHAMLEYGYIDEETSKFEVIDEIGLSNKSWDCDKEYYMDAYQVELDCMIEQFKNDYEKYGII